MKRLLAAILVLASLAAAPATEASSELKPFVRGSWQEMLRSHKGRPTLVHFWGVTCGPCKKAGLGTAENWLFSDGFVERLRFEIDPAWQGEIPRTLLIARDGAVTTIEGSAEIPDLEKWLVQQKVAAK